MASVSLTDEDGVYVDESVVRGHHIYKRVWSPIVGEVLELLREEENEHDRFAVCLLKPGAVTVGHIPRELSRKIWHFLRHNGKYTRHHLGYCVTRPPYFGWCMDHESPMDVVVVSLCTAKQCTYNYALVQVMYCCIIATPGSLGHQWTGSPGALGYWCSGALGHWCTGSLVHRCTGSLVHLVHWVTGAPGVLGHWCTGLLVHLVHWVTGAPGSLVHRVTGSPGALGHWCAWCTGLLVRLVHRATGAPGHWCTGSLVRRVIGSPGALGHWCTWLLVHRVTGSPGALGHWCTWLLVHLVHWFTCTTGALGHWCTGSLVHWVTGSPGALVHLVHQVTGSLGHWVIGSLSNQFTWWFT